MRVGGAVFVVSLAAAGLPAIATAQTPVQWSIAPLPPNTSTSSKPIDATLTAVIDEGWKVYSLTQAPGGPIALVITVPKDQRFSSAGPAAGPLPHVAFDPNFNFDTEYYEGKPTFKVPVRLSAGSGVATLRVLVLYQTCNQRLCLPPTEVELTAAMTDTTGNDGLRQVTTGSRNELTQPPSSVSSVPVPAVTSRNPSLPVVTSRDPSSPVVTDMAASRASTFGAYVGLAAVMGALSLLTPCVFPMVPITVSFFTNRTMRKQGAGRRASVIDAFVYGLGIVLTFTAVGFTLAVAFGAAGLNRFAADPWLNLGVTALFVAFALSLFGVWQIALPSRFVNAAARSDAGHGRWAGTLLMGLAFTITSFTCTAPFLGTLLVVAAQGDWQWPLAGMLAFSTVFASPFVALALAPRWIASLPRSGPWLVAVKAVMGLLEIAAAMKFLSNADLVWGWRIFSREVVLVTWLLIAVVLVVYLAGFIRLGGSRLGRPRGARMVATAAAALLGVWLASGLAGRRLGELEAFLPPADLAAATPDGELPWILNDYDAALAEASKQGRPLLVDFTGYTCTNCRWMEANMFPQPEVTRELARYVRVRLYTDGRDETNRRFQKMEQDMFGTVALPYYAVIGPNGVPRVAFGGLTRNSAEFMAFLRRGLE